MGRVVIFAAIAMLQSHHARALNILVAPMAIRTGDTAEGDCSNCKEATDCQDRNQTPRPAHAVVKVSSPSAFAKLVSSRRFEAEPVVNTYAL
jgi:hypothetical protein